MGRPKNPIQKPLWFDLGPYAAAFGMTPLDWLLNLKLRAWLHRVLVKQDDPPRHRASGVRSIADAIEELLRDHGPVLKLDDPVHRNELNGVLLLEWPTPGSHHETAFIWDLLADPPRITPGVSPLEVWQLYFWERRLPEEVRAAGAKHANGWRADRVPPAYKGRVDHAFPDRYLHRFTTVNLAMPDHVLVHDLLAFVRQERAESEARNVPYREALRTVNKRKVIDLDTLAKRQVLPLLDLQRWAAGHGVKWTDYQLRKLLGLDNAKELKEALGYADLATFEHALHAWLGPRARGVPPRSKARTC